MNRIASASLSVLLASGILSLTACNSGNSSSAPSSTSSALNLAGNWTVTTTSTQGHSSFSGMATVSQSGDGLGVTGTTTLTAPVGQVTLSQTGSVLTGTIKDSLNSTTFNFTGTLSSGNLTLSGSTPCPSSTTTQSVSITGAITSSSIQGNYTITRGSGCYPPSDAGTFVATKH